MTVPVRYDLWNIPMEISVRFPFPSDATYSSEDVAWNCPPVEIL